MKTKMVITYQSPNGVKINLTPHQISDLEKRGKWPRNESGEYCTVSHGKHAGEPTCETDIVSDLLAL